MRSNKRCRSEIGTGSNRLQNSTDGNEAGNVCHREAILARLDRLNAGGFNRCDEELNVRRFIRGDEFKVDEKLLVKAGIDEVL